MTALVPFDYAGQQVRTVMVDGEPWFVASDVANILGYVTAKDMTRLLDDDEKGGHLTPTPGGDQVLSYISEPGLYKVIVQRQTGRMKNPAQVAFVKAFQAWVTHEVLPSLRRTGTYSVATAQPELTREQRLAYAVLEADQWITELKATIEEIKPSADAWDALAADDGRDFSVREAAQVLSRDDELSIGQQRLFVYLRDIGWLDQRNGPYQSQIDNGRLSRKVSEYTDDYGQRFVKVQPRVTPKGLAELRKRLTAARTLRVVSSA